MIVAGESASRSWLILISNLISVKLADAISDNAYSCCSLIDVTPSHMHALDPGGNVRSKQKQGFLPGYIPAP